MTNKAAFLDLDNTVYDYASANDAGTLKVTSFLAEYLRLDVILVRERIREGRQAVHKLLHSQAAGHSRLLYLQKAIEYLTGATNCALSLAAEEVFWGEFLEHMQLFPGVKDFLVKIRAAAFKVVVVTDLTAQIQMRKLVRLGIAEFVDFVVSSEEAGVEKPSSTIFELAMQKAQCQSNAVIMIGDSYDKDCQGAIGVGIPRVFCRYTEKPYPPPVKMFKSFSDLLTEID